MTARLAHHFRKELAGGAKLCVMPVSRVLLERPIIDPIPGFVLLPPDTLDLSDLRTVWDPATAFGSEDQLGWAQTAATGVTRSEFTDEATVAFTVDFVDWPRFLGGDHVYHVEVLRRSSERAEHLMDLIRLDYCRMDLPETLPGRVSMLESGSPFSVGLYYSAQDHESYLTAGQVMQVARVGGLGLDLDHVTRLDVVENGEAGAIVRHGLTLFTQALEANFPSSKFAMCFVALEHLADPDSHEPMRKMQKWIGAHFATDTAAYHAFTKRMLYLHGDLRTKIVHRGITLEAEVPDPVARAEIFKELQWMIMSMLKDLIMLSGKSWAEVMRVRENRLVALGIKPAST